MLGLSRKERIAARAAEAAKAQAQSVKVAVALGLVEREIGVLRRSEREFAHLTSNSATTEKALSASWRVLLAARQAVDVARQAHQRCSQL